MEIWWKRLEEVPSEKETVKEFLKERNFTWKILSQPCYMKIGDEYKIISNHQISVRSDDLRPIAVVKNRYKLLDNDKCFEIADKFKSHYSQSKFISCGDIMNQKESYLSHRKSFRSSPSRVMRSWAVISHRQSLTKVARYAHSHPNGASSTNGGTHCTKSYACLA